MKGFSFRKLKSFFLISGALAAFCLPVFSRSKKADKKAGNNTEISSAEEKSSVEETATKLSAGKQRKYTFFSGIDQSVIEDVEKASPSSLRRAASEIRKNSADLKENEKVLLYIIHKLFEIVYPTERLDWECPSLSAETPYSGAVNSAENGIYDVSTGNVDFLSTVLPSLVVLLTDDVKEFSEASEKDLLTAIDGKDDSVLASYLAGVLYRKNGNYDKAEPYLKQASEMAPESLQIAVEQVYNLELLEKYEESFRLSKACLEKFPQSSELLKIISHDAYAMGDYSSSEDYTARILQQNPNDLDALLFRAKTLLARKDYIHAASLLDMYSRQDNTSMEYLVLRSQIQYDWSRNINASVSTIEQALQLYPDETEVMLMASRLSGASMLKINGKSEEEYALSVLEKDSENQEALFCAAEGFQRKKDYETAYGYSKKIIERGNASDEAVFSHVKLCLETDRKDEAWNLISPLYKEKSSDENVTMTYISCLTGTGRNTQALTLINQLLPQANSRMKSFLYYQRSILQKNEDDRLSDLRSSLISNPRNTDALMELYHIYYARNDYRKAQYYLKQVVALNPNDEEIRLLNDDLTSMIRQ